jgi:uncharacterized SAM-binding protein YcdF (DUF218 family)
MKNTGRRILIAIVLLFFLLLIVFASFAGNILVVNAPERSDVIVVLAGETERRPSHAVELLDQGYGRRILLDVPAAAVVYGFTDKELAEKYISRLPEAASIGICPIEGLSTRDESHDVEKCLTREADNRILIVTSDYHTHRALSIFRHELHGRYFSIAAAQDDRQFGTRWWSHRQWAKTCLEEWMRLAWWNAVDRWR